MTHISLSLVGLMWVLPFLYHDHPRPIATFYGEWVAAMLGLCAIFFLTMHRSSQQLQIPRIALLPIALLLLVLVQFVLGRGAYFEQSLLFALYLLWAALLIIIGRCLREEFSLPILVSTLALFLLVGAELSALIGVLQHYSGHYSGHTFPGSLVMANYSASVFGNLAQPNHFADYITLGLASLGLVYTRWKLRAWQLLLLAAPLLFVLVLSGSRSPWLYLPCITGMAFLWQRRDKSCLPLLHYCLLLLLSFGLMHLVVQIPWLTGPHGNTTGVQRLLEAGGAGGSLRLSIWYEAWLIFTQNPLLGAGFGQLPWQHFQLGPILRDANLSNHNGYIDHAHNLVLHLAAEMGLAGLLILFGTLALWLSQAYRAPRTAYHWWGYALLAVLALHSMLEYPLWYAYFLGVAAFTLGLLDDTSYRLAVRGNIGSLGRWLMLAMLLPGLLFLTQMLQDYRKLAGLYAAMPQAEATDDGYSRQILYRPIRDDLMRMQVRPTLLRPYIEQLLGDAGWNHIADNRALNERVMRYLPTSTVVHREVLLLARDGRQAEARKQMERAIWTYPKDFPVIQKQLEELARMDNNPSRFPALLDFALQTYGDWQHEMGVVDIQ